MQHTAAEHTLYYQLPQIGHVQRFHMSAYGRNFSRSISLTCGYCGLEVACWPLVPKFAGSNPAEAVGFFGRKNPQRAFFRRGSKAVCPMSYFTACKRTQKWRGSRHFRQILGHFSLIVPPSAAGFASVATDAGDLLWRELERSESLVLQVGGLTCRWQRHSVKTFCCECSTIVEQAKTQLRVVVPLEEEEGISHLHVLRSGFPNIRWRWILVYS
jgi:hypothetical protein